MSNLDIGGGQEVVKTLARYLPEVGCLPVVVTLRDGPLRQDLERMGIAVEIVEPRTRSVTHLLAAAKELRRVRRDLASIADRHGSEVIQTHLLQLLDFVVLSLRFQPTAPRVFWTFHNARVDLRTDQLPSHRWLLKPKQVAYRLLYRAGARWVDGLIAVSNEVAASVRHNYRPPAAKLVTIPNGVNLEQYGDRASRSAVRAHLGLPLDASVLIVVAKLMPQKGHATLLEAMESLFPRYPDLHVLVVGDGPLREALARRSERLPSSGRLRFLGNRLDIADLLASADLFVLPSLWEGLPMALLEAMASRLPIIATRVSGSAEAVVHEESGILVPPGDVYALAAAIAGMLDDPAKAQRMADAARTRVEELYGGRAQATHHAELYRAQ